MNSLTPAMDLPTSEHRLQTAREVWDAMGRMMGLDPENLPDADSLPPWTDEEAAEFKRLIYETCKRIDEPSGE